MAYTWSSAANHCGQRRDAWPSPHPTYTSLAPSPEARAAAYWQLLRQTLSDHDVAAIRSYLQQQRALGRDNFCVMVEAKTQRFAGIRPAHRPPRKNYALEVNLTPFWAERGSSQVAVP